MNNLEARLDRLLDEFRKAYESNIHLKGHSEEIQKLEKEMGNKNFWKDPNASEKSKLLAGLKKIVKPWENLRTKINETQDLIKLQDSSLTPEIEDQISDLTKDLTELKKELRFDGPYDDHDVILGIHAGAGGTDAQDWAQMLLRMYVRWAEKSKLKVQSLDQSPGEEAGIKSATIKISGAPHQMVQGGGDFLYGKLSGEHGVHRLVRLSPFNADNLRQTSFAKVEVLPSIDKPGEIQIDEKELKIDVFRASGRGGQSVNTTDSAVRITHLPTGISTSIQTERSQLQNKQTALAILRSKIVQLQLEQHTKNIAELKGPSQSAEWGSQIRSYVLRPYKQVKDLRTGYETTDPQSVLDGNLDPLINSWLEKL